MNRENLKKTRDLLAKQHEVYDQKLFWNVWPNIASNYCGTPACVAGFAVCAAGKQKVVGDFHRDSAGVARDFLEITEDEAVAMFEVRPWDAEKQEPILDPTAQQALAMLDHAIEHGVVRWSGEQR